MKTFVISGGNSGIGLEAGRQLAAKGHHVVLLGRDELKGQAAVAEMLGKGGTAEFIACDLSTHAGVKAASEAVLAKHSKLDGLLLGAGVLTTKDQRTADDLHVVFAVNYLSRYHLAQRLLPAVQGGKIVLLVAGVKLTSKIDFGVFPQLNPFPGMSALSAIQIANYHYVQQLAKTEKDVQAAVVNVGLVKTEIMRDMPALMKLAFGIFGPLITVSVGTSAANAVQLLTTDGWASGSYLPKPGKPDVVVKLELDDATGERVVKESRQLTGV
jgi:NAD(P)-dependent dehydrogenase (short-subunit alcohol dehydrogenase family)